MSIKLSVIFKLRKVTICIGSIVGVFFSSGVYAACTLKPTEQTFSINFGTVTVQRDMPVGKHIAYRSFDIGNVGGCNVATNLQTVLGIYAAPSPLAEIYNTNIPGVGITMRTVNRPNPSLWPIPINTTRGPIYQVVALVKTGPTGSGALNSGRIVRIAYQNLRWVNQVVLVGTAVQTVACSVSNTNIIVPMGLVSRTAFTGVGTPANERAFTVPLECDAGTRINITIDGLADGSGVAGVLALDSSGSDTVATGIGLQVLHDGRPVTLGTSISIGTAASAGGYSVPLTARYYQNAPTVTAGVANSTATFTMTYN
ncbi:fimbrial protein [Pseudomonas sp. Ma2-10]